MQQYDNFKQKVKKFSENEITFEILNGFIEEVEHTQVKDEQDYKTTESKIKEINCM